MYSKRLHQRFAQEPIEAIGGQRVSFSGGVTAWLPGEALEATTGRAVKVGRLYGRRDAVRNGKIMYFFAKFRQE